MTSARFQTQCTCSTHNANQDHWITDPHCPRHGNNPQINPNDTPDNPLGLTPRNQDKEQR